MISRSDGFTLYELLIGIAIAGIVLATAQRTFHAVTVFSSRTAVIDSTFGRQALSKRALRVAFMAVDMSRDTLRFEGTSGRIVFPAWFEGPEGWWEFAYATVEGTSMEGPSWGPVALDGLGEVRRFEYLAGPGRWLRDWSSASEAPIAVRVMSSFPIADDRIDTTAFLVGGRR